MTCRAHVVFRGKVQGVFFRANTLRKAVELGLVGWVRNLEDGSVEAVFEGERKKIEAAIKWCRTSQPYARVTDIILRWEAATGEFAGFEIVH